MTPPSPARLPAFVTNPVADNPPAQGGSPPAMAMATLVDGLAALLNGGAPESEIAAREAALLALGAAASQACVDRLDRAPADPPSTRERLFHLLRRLPGAVAEARLVREARQGSAASLRSMAIESLGQRASASEAAFEALSVVARQDNERPARPLLGEARLAANPSTELPDENTFTPRMQAMAALAGSNHPRAVDILADIARGGPDESLRMEAARNLGPLRAHADALATLRTTATSDPSANVRLAALHALHGAADDSLPPVLTAIATHDADAGVRLLAQQVLASLGR